jgi:cyclopropane fatty-acyl-phospholipid synthase-like methyltransferase
LDSEGWLHHRLVEAFPRVIGVESDQENVRALQAAGYGNVRVGDAQDLQLGERFDTIVAGELIEHLERPGDLLASARAHLKEEGAIILTTPYAFSLLFVIYAWLKYPKTCSNEEHTLWLCPSTAQVLIERAGLRVTKWELVEDYRSDLPSRAYRRFLRLYPLLRRVLPDRMRCNCMVIVARRA